MADLRAHTRTISYVRGGGGSSTGPSALDPDDRPAYQYRGVTTQQSPREIVARIHAELRRRGVQLPTDRAADVDRNPPGPAAHGPALPPSRATAASPPSPQGAARPQSSLPLQPEPCVPAAGRDSGQSPPRLSARTRRATAAPEARP